MTRRSMILQLINDAESDTECLGTNTNTSVALVGVALTVSLALASAQGADCLPRPVLSVAQQAANLLRLEVAGEPGFNYAVERSGDTEPWTPVATNRTSSGVVSFIQPISTNLTRQFFRARSVNSADGLGGSFIFDGVSSVGWEGDTAGAFRIADCAIVGGSLAHALPENVYLCTTRRYTNFVLRLDFKLVGASGFVNAGIQFRSKRVPGSQEVSGYQADIGEGYWGSLYDQSRRDTVLAAVDQNAVGAVLKRNEWNTYVIQAEGARLRFWINGYQTIDYTEADDTISQNGVVGLQVHSGGALEASFRHISLEVLP